eukprot:15456828-Alexandrium_andersonii.AAC.1
MSPAMKAAISGPPCGSSGSASSFGAGGIMIRTDGGPGSGVPVLLEPRAVVEARAPSPAVSVSSSAEPPPPPPAEPALPLAAKALPAQPLAAPKAGPDGPPTRAEGERGGGRGCSAPRRRRGA